MASYDPNQLASALVSKGYNPTDAKNASIGPRADELAREYLGVSSAPVSTSTSGSGFTSLDPQQTIQATIKALQEANKPAVESLQAQIPETQAKYTQTRTQLQASQPTLEQKYKLLLDEIKGNQQEDTTAQTKATNANLAARGLSTQDPGAQQDLANALSPINKTYTNLANKTGLAEVDAIRELQNSIANLTPNETSDIRSINNAIAALSSGAGSQGLTTGLNLYSANLAGQTASNDAKAKADQQVIANAIAQAQLANETRKTNYEVNKPYSTDGEGINLEDIVKLRQMLDPNSAGGTSSYQKPPYSSPSNQSTQVEYPKGSGVVWSSDGKGGWV